MVSGITGRTVREETTEGRAYDVMASIRVTRMRWLGKILQMKEERMVLRAVKMLYQNRKEGDILTDAPATDSWEELRELAKDKKEWNVHVRKIKDQIFIKATDDKTSNKKGKKRKSKGKEGAEDESNKSASAASASTDMGEKKQQKKGGAAAKRNE